MDNYIPISTTQRPAAFLKAALDRLRSAIYDLEVVKANMDQTTDALDWTTLESVYGLEAGDGQALYNLTAGAVAEVAADTNLQQLLTWTQAVG